MKLWGGRFSGKSASGAEAFGAAIGFDHRLWPYDVMGSAAHTRMLARCGIVPIADARAILAGLSEVASELATNQLDFAPHWEDIHTRIEARLTELVGAPAGRLHTARSRNDQIALDVRLLCREAILDQLDGLIHLMRALLELGARGGDALIPGYTHLQRAQPVLFSHHVHAYVEMLERDAGRLLDCYRRTDVMPLGSGALAGVPYPIDRDLTARLLGFSSITRNSIDAVSDRDFVVELVSALALIATHLSRLAEELVLWSTAEFGFITLDEAYTTGSSMMPQKRNPDLAELVRGKTGRVMGHLVALLALLKALPLAYDKDLQEDKEALFDAVDTVAACVGITTEMIRSLRINRERASQAAAGEFSLATDYADYLTRKGIPFRDAHQIVGQLVQLCERSGRELHELTLDELTMASPLFERDAVGITAEGAIAARDVPGGTAPSRVQAASRAAEARLGDLDGAVQRLREAFPSLDRLLSEPL
ncbi:MAG: argininosuccinate lyase [Chloroflexi bacterium]|nr:argininosuccinate lyase [Chloroflexota bacterium]